MTRASLFSVCLCLLVSASAVQANGAESSRLSAEAGRDEASDSGVPRVLTRVIEAGTAPKSVTLLLGTGYGYTEGVLGLGDRHDRILGNVGLDARALPWLSVGVLFAGRYDRHVVPGESSDTGLIGVPSLRLRVDRRLSPSFAINAHGELSLPGSDAPSLVAAAMTPSLSVAASYAPSGLPLTLSGNLGYRLDRSARAAPEPRQLSASDRLVLGASSFDALLVGVAARLSRGRWETRAEARWDILVGQGAPPPRQAPLIVGAGVRWAFDAQVALESMLEMCPSERPELVGNDVWIPVPPRIAALIGLSYRWGAEPRADIPPRTSSPSSSSSSPLSPELDAKKSVQGTEQLQGPPEPSEGAEHATELPPVKKGPGGEIRGNIRSVHGVAVQADIEILSEESSPPEPRHLRATGGHFAIEVEPGSYAVVVAAQGYEQQRRRITVEADGVTLLNVELKVRK